MQMEDDMNAILSARLLTLVFAITAAPATPGYAGRNGTTADVGGTWAVTVQGSGAHGDMTATLTLQQDGRKVTGRLAVHGNAHTVSGEFDGSTLRLTIEQEAHDQTTLTGTLQEDGTLAGYVSGPMGDMEWTATRAKDK